MLQLSETFNPTATLSELGEKSTDITEDSPEILFDCEWPELNVRDLYSEKVSSTPLWTEDREYRYFFKYGEFKGAVLKTPHFVGYSST